MAGFGFERPRQALGALTVRFALFDLDGTLVDSAPGIASALNKALSHHGFAEAPLAHVRTLLGEDAFALVNRAIRANGEGISEDRAKTVVGSFLEIYSKAPAEGTALYPGALDMLERLRADGLRLGICTNKPTKTGHPVLTVFDLFPYFDAVSFGDSGPHKKPDGRHVLSALSMMQAEPAAAVMIGDAANDIQAANDAGVRSVLVEFGYDTEGAMAASPTVVAGALSEIPELVARL